MVRDRSLVPLSHQHHNALALCVLTDRSLAADGSEPNVRKLAARVVDRFDLEMTNHFQLEETVLFPRVTDLSELADRLREEHRELRAMAERLRSAPDADVLRRFTATLRRHIRTEENEYFEQAQRLLSPEVLEEIGAILDRDAVRVCL